MEKSKKWRNLYQEIGVLGTGGNAKVYHVKCKDDNKEYALKDLYRNRRGKEKCNRFVNEINIINDNWKKIEGIIPICKFDKEEHWYTMPIAKPAINYVIENKLDIKDIIQGIIQLCQTLEQLHKKDIYHRDIKPSNIYYYNNRFCFGDFGLVDFPDNVGNFTKSNKGLGAVFTIAPEMKRNPKKVNGEKADVFSLAKTTWMLLMQNEKGFDGVYNYLDYTHSLRYSDKYNDTHIVEIEELLKDSTDNNPDIRPTIKEFKKRLINWIDIFSDVYKSHASDWNFLSKQLFTFNAPDSASWSNIDKIVEVLNIVGKTPAYNHLLFHDKGGIDFFYAKKADEDNCIKIYDSLMSCYIVKPKRLYFEGFNEDCRWNYFLLELGELFPIFDNENCLDYEYLVEDYPAHYVSAQYAQYGVYDYEKGDPLPKDFEIVNRYTRGKLLIVMKIGPYNAIDGTYDGRHGDCSAIEFKDYIDKIISKYNEIYNYVKQNDKFNKYTEKEIENKILKLDVFSKNPFKNVCNDTLHEVNTINSIKNKEKIKQFIKENYNIIDFKSVMDLSKKNSQSKIKYSFIFKIVNQHFSLENLKEINNYLCTDGYIKRINSVLEKECYYVYDRKDAINIKDRLEKKMLEFLQQNNLQGLDKEVFSIELTRNGKPSHLFTKKLR